MTSQDPRRPHRRVFPLVVLALFLAATVLLGAQLSLEDAKALARSVQGWSAAHLALAVAAIALAQLLSGLTAIPTKGVMTLVGGALVGPLFAGVATLVGVGLGTSALFFATRQLLHHWARSHLGPRLAWVENRLSRRPIWSMIALRLMITLPYGPITMAAALSRLRYRDFLIGSLIGDLPVIVLYALAGSQLETLASTKDAIDPWSAALLIAAATVMLAGVFLGGRGRSSQMGT